MEKKDELQGNILENELIALYPNSLKNTQQFFTKFKSLALECKQCRIERKDEKLVLSVRSKLGSEYFVFVSSFHCRRASIPNWKMPSLDAFVESLIQEQDKLVQMGVLRTSKNLALLVTDSNNVQSKGKHKGKDPKSIDSKPKENQRYFDGTSGSKKKNKFEKTRCPYCMRGFHLENECMKKNIEQLSTLLEHNNISLPQGKKKFDAGQST